MRRLAFAFGLFLFWVADAVQAAPSGATASAPLTIEQARGYVAELRATDAQTRHTERQLQFIHDDDAPPPASRKWWIDSMRWVPEAARWVVWLIAAFFVAAGAVRAWRWMRVRAARTGSDAARHPSHVHDLDIRPGSLPGDVAGAARALLERGDERAALSLLYRGALSRLVHDHGVAIRDASTEGECVRLASATLSQAAGDYFEHLVQAWQSEVYADRRNGAAAIAALCARFDTHFATAAQRPPRQPAAAPA